MPELPEVETVRRSLLPLVVGARITTVVVREHRLRRRIPPAFAARLRNRRIVGIDRRGKYLLFALEPAGTLLVHLGMSGSIILRPPGRALLPHDHVFLRLSVNRDLVLNDPRRFSLMRLGSGEKFPELRNLGPDPLSEHWSPHHLRALVDGRRLPIKNLLMNQQAISGIGNIYANEVLYRAAIRPRRRAATLRRHELEALARSMRSVLDEAVRLGGSSISDFRDGSGRPGTFQLHLAVYGREGEPCTRYGTRIRRVLLSGRSSFYCAKCQR
jgi:formamidopyrimidine-DNA glycosylase